jgi:hypothetical protein
VYSRYYNPVTQRFISEAPIRLAGGPNLYKYAVNSPTVYRDPSGKFIEGCLIGMAGYAFGQAINGLAGRKMDSGLKEVEGFAGNCAVGFVNEGIGAWAGALAEAAEELGPAARAAEELGDLAEEGCGLCFPAGTPVRTRHGRVPIEKIKVGDEVLSRNMSSGKLEYKKVIGLTKPHLDKLLDLRVEGEGQSLRPTPNHPFWVKRGDKAADWMKAGEMQIGDLVLTDDGKWNKVTATVPLDGQQTVYNFEVADDHDYFVGTTGLLVHNTFCLGKTDGLIDFAKDVGGDTYLDPSRGISTLRDVINIIDSGEDIAVNLEQSPEVIADEVENVQNGVNSINPTAFEQELQYIQENPGTWKNITWYGGGGINPFQ